MKILVVGSGGREHAICHAFSLTDRVQEIFCASGNAGIAQIAKCISIKPDDVKSLSSFAAENKIDLTFVGGETSLALGITDKFEEFGLRIIGPSRKAALLESSKVFAKEFMSRHGIPTADFRVANSARDAVSILESGHFADRGVVVKADGLAAGKGVIVCSNSAEARNAVSEISSGEIISKEAASKIVLEEKVFGREVSLLMFCDGRNFALMPPARDHKRIGEGDTGANTGGMGVITDANLLSAKQLDEIVSQIIEPTLKGAREEGFPFRGILFLGLMMTAEGASVLEYNVRFGDPETQAILVRLESDFVEICEAISEERLEKLSIKWKQGSSACVVIAAKNYPAKPQTGDEIFGLDQAAANENVHVFHSGTAKDDEEKFISSGGRVLSVTATGVNLKEALSRAYDAVNEISFEGMQFRRDIGK